MRFLISSKTSFFTSKPRLRHSALNNAKPSAGVVVGKSGIFTSTRPGRFNSTSIKSGQLEASTQSKCPRLSESDISFAIIE